MRGGSNKPQCGSVFVDSIVDVKSMCLLLDAGAAKTIIRTDMISESNLLLSK